MRQQINSLRITQNQAISRYWAIQQFAPWNWKKRKHDCSWHVPFSAMVSRRLKTIRSFRGPCYTAPGRCSTTWETDVADVEIYKDV